MSIELNMWEIGSFKVSGINVIFSLVSVHDESNYEHGYWNQITNQIKKKKKLWNEANSVVL